MVVVPFRLIDGDPKKSEAYGRCDIDERGERVSGVPGEFERCVVVGCRGDWREALVADTDPEVVGVVGVWLALATLGVDVGSETCG